MLLQILSVLGALLVLGAYAALQLGRLGRDDRLFHVLNFLGGVLLAWVAIADRRVGFILLEGSWALLSVPGMLRRQSASTGDPTAG